ncbi:GIY-YIG catalytic domain-containing endonuclease [Acanthocystis turfacea Chlorella virus OR0704.3]|nr:GIY-YIG catalytic domain-containing endonuclease [Acanthocystis turfacea Chlorella virus OR0704.3]
MSSHAFIEMMVTKEFFNLLSIAYFVLDNVMFWEAFRWERLDVGYIYIQKFSNDMMYAGLTIDLKRRMKEYKILKGSNKHHTRALKKYINTIQIAFTQCPNYLLDAVEIFVIAFFDLTNPTKGYNKTTGGRNGYRLSKYTRMKMSVAHLGEKNHMFGKHGELSTWYGRKHSEETRSKMSKSMTGKTCSEETRAKISDALSGEKSPFFGKTRPEETRAKMSIAKSGENHPMFGRSHTEETRVKMAITKIGKSHTEETRDKISENMTGKKHTAASRAKMSVVKSGENNPKAKPISVFGKLYGTAKDASDTLRDVCDTTSNGNFMKEWTTRKKHQHNIFYVSKEFYNTMKNATEIITLDIYGRWSAQL